MTRSIVAILVFMACIPPFVHADDKEDLCRQNLQTLSDAIKLYRQLHDGKGPAKLSDLYYEDYADELARFRCPAGEIAGLERTEIDGKSDYTIEPIAGQPAMIVRERAHHHGDDATVLAAFEDGSIKAIALPDAAPPANPPIVVKPTDPSIPSTAPANPPIAANPPASAPAPNPGEIAIAPPKKKKKKPAPVDVLLTPAQVAAVQTQLAEATKNYNGGEFALALKQYDAILQVDPKNVQAMTMRGASKYFLNDMKGALADYDAAAAMNPMDPAASKYAMFVALCLDDLARAKRDADAFLATNPNDVETLLVRAQVAMLSEESGAANLFARVAVADPTRAAALYHQGGVTLQKQLYRPAAISFRSVLQLDPNYYYGWYGLAQAEAGLGNNKTAITAYENYLRSDQTSAFAQNARTEIDRLKKKKKAPR